MRKKFRPFLLLKLGFCFMLSVGYHQTVFASEAPIINGRQQMAIGEEQVLSIMNFQTGTTYTWSLLSGGGSLSASSGESVTYTAPASIASCDNMNPTIRVSSEYQESQIQIAINGYTQNAVAVKEVTDAGDCYHVQDTQGFWLAVNPTWCGLYRCDGSQILEPCYSARGDDSNDCEHATYVNYCWLHPETQSYACNSSGGLGIFDMRTSTMKNQGCCPEQLLPDYEPKQYVPEGLDSGENPDAKFPVCESDNKVSNPISIYHGNKFESETDISLPSPGGKPFEFKRYYNSRSETDATLGYGWGHNMMAFLTPSYEYNGELYLMILDETGRAFYFTDEGNGLYSGAFKELSHVQVEGTDYVWYRLDGRRFVFDSNNNLIRIEEASGKYREMTYANNLLQSVVDKAADDTTVRTLTFYYNQDGRIVSIEGPQTPAVSDGVWVEYGYDGNGNLTTVDYADGSGFIYVYEDEFNDPDDHNLTAKKDKQGRLISSWGYNNASDRANSSFTRDGKGVTINYDAGGNKVDVTDAYGTTRTYDIWDIDGRRKVTAISGTSGCASCGTELTRIEYDSQGRVIEVEYANGRIDQFGDFDSRGNAQTVYEAVGTADAKTITYTFHPEIDAKLTRTEASVLGGGDKITIWDYDNDSGSGDPNENPTRQVYRKIEMGFTKNGTGVIGYTDTTVFEYNAKKQVTLIDGPRPGDDDSISFIYNSTSGNLESVTLPNIGTTTYSNYTASGQPGTITDPNGRVQNLTYDGRDRVATITNVSDSSETTFEYEEVEIKRIEAANGTVTDFAYEATNGRLDKICDRDCDSSNPSPNYIQFGYDDQGNRTDISYYDSQNNRQYWKRFDYENHPTNPGKLWKEINPDNTYSEYLYDAAGNIDSITDAAGKTTSFGYDLYKRVVSVTQPGDLATFYDYDLQGNLAEVTDAESHPTSYANDDLRMPVTRISPDTGTTDFIYDAANNLLYKTEANGQVTSYVYDDANRLTDMLFPGSADDVGFTYDEGTNGKGHLTGMTDASGAYIYLYDAKGYLQETEATIENVGYLTSYDYDAAGILTSMTYPDGRIVTYELENGSVIRVTTTKDQNTVTLAENITYKPFGPISGMTLGSGLGVTLSYDQLYRPTGVVAGAVQDLSFTLDYAGNVEAITNNLDSSRDQSFTDDNLYRLTAADGIYGNIGFTYDDIGNRLTRTEGVQTDTYAYEQGTSLLSSISGANPATFTYDDSGNLIHENRVIAGTGGLILAEYTYNGIGQRIKKTTGGVTTIHHYDINGNLIAESAPNGDLNAIYVYLGNMRLATIIGANIYYHLNDHLGTPQKLINTSNQVVWAEDYLPFGKVNITVASVVNNFRFPGQYYDQETGLHYNYHRYYNPATGRYLTPDPIGLDGGINLFAYALNSPVNLVDPWGLEWKDWQEVIVGTIEGTTSVGLKPKTSYGYSTDTDIFVALPDENLRGKYIELEANGKKIQVPVGDVGPWNGGHTYSGASLNDPYWDNNSRPQAESGIDFRGRKTNKAGIDISHSLAEQLGLKGTTKVRWRGIDDCDQ